MAELIVDQLYLIVAGVFVMASLAIISHPRRGGTPSSDHLGIAGLRTATLASLIPVVAVGLLVVGVGWLLRGMFWGTSAAGPTAEPDVMTLDNLLGLLTLLAIPWVTFFAVLDLYAMYPPAPAHRAGDARTFALLGTLFSLSLLGGALLVPVVLDGIADSDAKRDGEAAYDQYHRDLDARSAALSIEVTVIDADLGAPTHNGRVVDHMTLDIRVRSTTDIELREGADGIGQQGIWFRSVGPRADGTTSGTNAIVDIEWRELPTHIPAGFDAMYRVDVPVPPEERQSVDPAATGTWIATLFLQDRSPGPVRVTSQGSLELYYQATAEFTVTDSP